MSEKNNFSNVQRLNSAVMAKYEWKSSLRAMQKSGEETHDRRTKTYRKANQFLQELLEQRSDGSSLDDTDVIDRYNKFLRNKSNSNNDSHLLDEFNRRLNALNNNRQNQTSKTLKSTNKPSISTGLQTKNEMENDSQETIQYRPKPLSKSTIRSTLSITNANASSDISPEENQTDIILNTDEHELSFFEEYSTSPLNRSIIETLDKAKARRTDGDENVDESSTSILNLSIKEPFYKPKARRIDANEDIEDSSTSSLNRPMKKTFHKPKARRADDDEESSTSLLNHLIKEPSHKPVSALDHSMKESLYKPKARRIDGNEDIEDSSAPSLNLSMTKTRQIDGSENAKESQINHPIMKTLPKPTTRQTDGSEDPKESSTPPLNHSPEKTLHKPKARLPDGSERIVTSTENPLQTAPSNVLLFKHCYFPRSLTSRESVNTTATTISKLSSPVPQIKQYDSNQLFHLLDEIENECSAVNFTAMLDQLTLSSVQIHQTDDNISLTSDDQDEDILIIPNLFDQPSLSHDYYTTFTININDPRKLSLYTMTIGTVQLGPDLVIPYSILNGRRPLLQSSVQTNFKQVHSKQQKTTCQVTAVESLTHMEHLQENDIIVKINDRSVWNLTIDAVRDILHEYSKQTNNCSLRIVRLCQPLI